MALSRPKVTNHHRTQIGSRLVTLASCSDSWKCPKSRFDTFGLWHSVTWLLPAFGYWIVRQCYFILPVPSSPFLPASQMQHRLRRKPRWSLLPGHSTICDTVWTIIHLHFSEDARLHSCRFVTQSPLVGMTLSRVILAGRWLTLQHSCGQCSEKTITSSRCLTWDCSIRLTTDC